MTLRTASGNGAPDGVRREREGDGVRRERENDTADGVREWRTGRRPARAEGGRRPARAGGGMTLRTASGASGPERPARASWTGRDLSLRSFFWFTTCMIAMKRPNLIYLAGGWGAILLAALSFGLSYRYLYLTGSTFQEIGPLGDWVAGLTAPFLNLAGFFMIYAAFREQRRASQETRAGMTLQRFESTFFQLLSTHHQNVQAIQQSFSRKSHEDFFEAAIRFLRCGQFSGLHTQDMRDRYAEFHEQNYSQADLFCRHVLFMVHYIHHNGSLPEVADRDQRHYLDILLAQLAPDELLLLFYHTFCLESPFTAQMRPLLRAYGFFDRLVEEDLLLEPSGYAALQGHSPAPPASLVSP